MRGDVARREQPDRQRQDDPDGGGDHPDRQRLHDRFAELVADHREVGRHQPARYVDHVTERREDIKGVDPQGDEGVADRHGQQAGEGGLRQPFRRPGRCDTWPRPHRWLPAFPAAIRRAQQQPPDGDRGQLQRGDDHDDHEHDTERPVVDESAQGVLQGEPDTARSDEAEHDRSTQVDVDPVDEGRDPRRHDLRQHPVDQFSHRPRAGTAHRLPRARLTLLDRVGEQLAQHADRVQCQGQHAGQHADTHGAHEQHGEDQVRDGTAEGDDASSQGVDERVRRGVAGCQEGQRHRDRRRENGPEHRDQQRLQRQ